MSWVATITVTRLRCAVSRRMPITEMAVALSSSPVGSSANITAGPVASALAIAHPLLLAARQLVGPVAGPRAESNRVQRLGCSPPTLSPSHSPYVQRQLHVLLRRQQRHQAE